MNHSLSWFNADKPSHCAYFALLILVVNALMWALLGSGDKKRISTRKPIVILEVVPHQKKIGLGDPYILTVLFEKTRADCVNGKLLRHMWEVENGWAYKVEEIDTIVAEPGFGKITTSVPTHPMRKEDQSLMQRGFWTLKTKITYDCPAPTDRGFIERETVFSSPVFQVGGE